MKTIETIYLAGGCLWGVQYFFKEMTVIHHVEAGRANGTTNSLVGPYDGYAECVKIDYDPEKISLTQLLDYFFEIIDPYSLNQQGFDKGEKYRTGIYSQKAEPLLVARQYIDARDDADKIRVEVKPLTNYIASALIHQNHLDIYPEDRYLCHLPTAVLNRYRKTQPVQD